MRVEALLKPPHAAENEAEIVVGDGFELRRQRQRQGGLISLVGSAGLAVRVQRVGHVVERMRALASPSRPHEQSEALLVDLQGFVVAIAEEQEQRLEPPGAGQLPGVPARLREHDDGVELGFELLNLPRTRRPALRNLHQACRRGGQLFRVTAPLTDSIAILSGHHADRTDVDAVTPRLDARQRLGPHDEPVRSGRFCHQVKALGSLLLGEVVHFVDWVPVRAGYRDDDVNPLLLDGHVDGASRGQRQLVRMLLVRFERARDRVAGCDRAALDRRRLGRGSGVTLVHCGPGCHRGPAAALPASKRTTGTWRRNLAILSNQRPDDRRTHKLFGYYRAAIRRRYRDNSVRTPAPPLAADAVMR